MVPSPAAVFKPYIVHRPNGGCTVEFPLSKLDNLLGAAMARREEALKAEVEALRLAISPSRPLSTPVHYYLAVVKRMREREAKLLEVK